MKIYTKRGKLNYKEQKIVKAIELQLLKIAEKNPEILSEFTPATTPEELKALHEKYCEKFDSYEEIKETKPNETPSTQEPSIEEKHNEFKRGMEQTAVKPEETQQQGLVTDPFNTAQPLVRDYVLTDEFANQNSLQEKNDRKDFGEPTSFSESFEMPNEEEMHGANQSNTRAEASGNTSQEKDGTKEKKSSTVNPKFDEMSEPKKRRSTKKLAKMIVDATCMLAERGCIWYSTKEITADKLVQYELEDTIDMQVLLSLEDDQKITVKQWFQAKELEAQDLFKISPEDKEDLTDSLFEVLMEKGVAPTPMQELMINAVKTFVLDMGIKAFALSSQIKSVLLQLQAMKNGVTVENQNQASSPESTTTTQSEVADDTMPNNPALALEITEDERRIVDQLPE